MKPSRLSRTPVVVFLILLAWLAAACLADTPAPGTPAPGTRAPGTSPVETTPGTIPVDGTLPPGLPEASPTPTETATPAPGLVILLAPGGADPALVQSLQPVLARLAEQNGLILETTAALDPADLASRTARIVVILPPDPGTGALASSAPQTQFVAIGIPGLTEQANLSLIGPMGEPADQIGFIAGLIATITTPDWRVGVLADESPAGQAASTGFANGTVYFCGLCRPIYPPYYDPQNNLIDYPVSASVPAGSGEAEIRLAAEYLLSQSVGTVYITPGAVNEAALTGLAEAGVSLISSGPLPDTLAAHLVATIQPDPAAALESIWPDLLAGRGGARLPLSLAFSNVNETVFTPGKQAEARQILSDLLDGLIGTGN